MLTMRLFAEEKRQGTIELLATSPVSDLQVVMGKFLAAHPRGGHDGAVIVDVEAEAGRDVRAELAWAVVTKGHSLLGLQQMGMSLEEIFLHLTTTDAAESAPAA
jgi:hypothetical protein